MRCGRRTNLFGQGGLGEQDDKWCSDNTCSYCGSISPEELFKAIEAGEEIGPTDKNYKIYVGGHRKFYFHHLDEEGQKRFIELYNKRTMKIGIPGYFYQLPFFMTYTEPERL